MIKSIIKKNIKFYSKLALLIGAFIVFICSFGVSSFAYTENDYGNLVSSNLFDYNKISSNYLSAIHAVTIGTPSINGAVVFDIQTSQDNDPFIYFHDIVTLPSGTYSWSFNSNAVLEQIGFTPNDSTNFDISRIQNALSGSNTFTLTSDTTLGFGFEFLREINTSITIMLNSGSTPLDYEMYGAVYYSQANYNAYGSEQYNEGVNSVFDGLRDFNAIQSYYSISTLFYSTNGGSTYSNLNSLGYTGQYVVDGNLLVEMQDSHDWAYGSNVIYYLDIQFTTPIYISNLYLPSIQRPNPVNVQFSDFSYDFNYTMVDGVGYFVTRNIYKITDNLRFYFTAYADMPHEFEIIIKGFNNAIDTYSQGFNDGVDSLQNTIDGLNENIQVLKNQNATLKTQLEMGNSSWTSLFFAMADTPFKTASNFLGFEIFGVNLFNALIGFITILAIFWVFKRLIK